MKWVYEELVGIVLEFIGGLFALVTDEVLSAFSLDTAMFDAYVPFFSQAQSSLIYFSIALCVFVFLMALIKNQFVLVFGDYEEPLPLCLKFIFALIFCLNAKKIINLEFQLFADFYIKLINLDAAQDCVKTFVNSLGIGDAAALGIGLTITTLLGTTGIVFAALTLVASIILIVVAAMISVSFFKLLLETAERYVVINLGLNFSMLVGCTIITKNGQRIFLSYLKTVFSQLLLLCLNVVFIRGTLQCLATAAQPEFTNGVGEQSGGFITWFVFTMAFMRAGMAIDSYARSMGLDVVQTGGALFDSITGAAQSMYSMGRTMGGFKGGIMAAQGALGKGLESFGAKVGNETMQNFGQKMQSPSGKMANGIAAAVSDLKKGANSGIYNGATIAKGVAGGLTGNLPAAAASSAFGELKNIPGIANANISANDGCLQGDLGDGRSFTLSQNPTSGATGITDASGNEWYLSSTGSVPLSSSIGQVGETQSLSEICGTDAQSIASSIGGGLSADDITAINQGNGYIELSDASGNTLGSLNPDANDYGFIASPSTTAYEQAISQGMGAETQTRALLGEGYAQFSSLALDRGGENVAVMDCSVSNGVATIKTSDQSMYKILPASEYTGTGGHTISYAGTTGILTECNAKGQIPKSIHRRNV